jgi:hypothetical protein
MNDDVDVHAQIYDLSIKALVHQFTLSHVLASLDEATLQRMHEDIAASLEASVDERPDAIGPMIRHLDSVFSGAGLLQKLPRPPAA